jgi:hypothetical protein
VNATTNAATTYRYFQKAGQALTDELAPLTDRTAILNPGSMVEFLDATKGLFAAQSNLNEQFREGIMGRTGGFDVGENTLLPVHTTGTLAGSPLTNGANLGTTTTANSWVSTTDLSIDGATSATTLVAGDIITISGVYAVHPESKANTGRLQTFVVQSSVTLTTAATAYTVTVKPGLIRGSGNAFQNVVSPVCRIRTTAQFPVSAPLPPRSHKTCSSTRTPSQLRRWIWKTCRSTAPSVLALSQTVSRCASSNSTTR